MTFPIKTRPHRWTLQLLRRLAAGTVVRAITISALSGAATGATLGSGGLHIPAAHAQGLAATARPIHSTASWFHKGHGGFAFAFGSVWHATGSSVLRINPANNRIFKTINVGDGATWIWVQSSEIWVNTAGATVRIDPHTSTVIGKYNASRLYAFGSYWDMRYDGDLVRTDPQTGKVLATVPVQGVVDWKPQLTAGFGSVWVGSGDNHTVVRVDPTQNRVAATIRGLAADYSLLTIAVGFGSVWAQVNAGAGGKGVVYRINPDTNTIAATISASSQGFGQYGGTQIAFGKKSVWVANANGTISRIDPGTNKVVAAVQVPMASEFIGIGFHSLWVCDDNGVVERISLKPFKLT